MCVNFKTSSSAPSFSRMMECFQILWRQRIWKHSIIRENDGALDEVLKFTHIARPRVRLKRRQRFSWYVLDGLAHAPGKKLYVVHHQRHNVFASLSQGWQLDRKHVQAIKKIGAKSVLL